MGLSKKVYLHTCRRLNFTCSLLCALKQWRMCCILYDVHRHLSNYSMCYLLIGRRRQLPKYRDKHTGSHLHTGDDYHGLLALRTSTWHYALPSVITLHMADHCFTTSKNQIELFAKKLNWNRSKFNNHNRNITRIECGLLEHAVQFMSYQTYWEVTNVMSQIISHTHFWQPSDKSSQESDGSSLKLRLESVRSCHESWSFSHKSRSLN